MAGGCDRWGAKNGINARICTGGVGLEGGLQLWSLRDCEIPDNVQAPAHRPVKRIPANRLQVAGK
jgi:hypothetical protein